jgi:hypothetical protein
LKQGTTYPITLTIPGINLEDADWCIVSVKPQNKAAIEFPKDACGIAYANDATTIVITLTQEQSLALTSSVTIDCNWSFNGVRGGAIPVTINTTGTLLQRVVE